VADPKQITDIEIDIFVFVKTICTQVKIPSSEVVKLK